MNLFEDIMELFKFKKDHTIKLFEAFAGIGTQHMALKMLTKVELVGISEIDKYALLSYEAIHGEVENFGDICNIKGKELPEIDLFTYSFPCQDLSKAGKQKGMASGTRSGLVWEVVRILEEMPNKPKVLLMENVVDLVQAKFVDGFNELQTILVEMGYSNWNEVLNAKDFGVAQNRQRVFMISILGDYTYTFPRPFRLEKILKDYLEDEVDEKYYLTDKMLNGMRTTNYRQYKLENRLQKQEGIAKTILASFDGAPAVVAIPENTQRGYSLAEEGDGVYINRPHQKRGVVQKGIMPTLKTKSDDIGVVVKNKKQILADDLINSGVVKGGEIIEHSFTSSKARPTLESSIKSNNGIFPTITTRPDTLGYVELVKMGSYFTWPNKKGDLNTQSNRAVEEDGCALTIATQNVGNVLEEKTRLRIRKLTPLETWRLMGISDDNFYRAKNYGLSDTQLYKQAGNAIVVDVLYYLFKNLIEREENEFE